MMFVNGALPSKPEPTIPEGQAELKDTAAHVSDRTEEAIMLLKAGSVGGMARNARRLHEPPPTWHTESHDCPTEALITHLTSGAELGGGVGDGDGTIVGVDGEIVGLVGEIVGLVGAADGCFD